MVIIIDLLFQHPSSCKEVIQENQKTEHTPFPSTRVPKWNHLYIGEAGKKRVRKLRRSRIIKGHSQNKGFTMDKICYT